MNTGPLDRLVTLQAPVVARETDFGAEVITWTDVDTVWARRTEDSASEAVGTQQRVMTRQVTHRIRWRADVLTTWRLVDGTRKFRISGTLEVGRQRWLDLLCEETSDA